MTAPFFVAEEMPKAELLRAASWGKALKAAPWAVARSAHLRRHWGGREKGWISAECGSGSTLRLWGWKEHCALRIVEWITGFPLEIKYRSSTGQRSQIPHTDVGILFSFCREKTKSPAAQGLPNEWSVFCDPYKSCACLINRQPKPYQLTEGKFPVLPMYPSFWVHSCPLPILAKVDTRL